MGWFFTSNQNRTSYIDSLTRDESCIHSETKVPVTRTCLAHTIRGNVLWVVWKIDTPEYTKIYIGCDLLKKPRNEGWGHKPMDEAMHPYYYSCPLKYLKMAPVANEQWRENVKAFHKQNRSRRIPKNLMCS